MKDTDAITDALKDVYTSAITPEVVLEWAIKNPLGWDKLRNGIREYVPKDLVMWWWWLEASMRLPFTETEDAPSWFKCMCSKIRSSTAIPPGAAYIIREVLLETQGE